MGNVESAVAAGKATMQMNKFTDNVGKGFDNLTKSGKKKEDPDDNKQSGVGSGIMNMKMFDHQRRQSAISKDFNQQKKDRQQRQADLASKWQDNRDKNASPAEEQKGGWFGRGSS